MLVRCLARLGELEGLCIVVWEHSTNGLLFQRESPSPSTLRANKNVFEFSRYLKTTTARGAVNLAWKSPKKNLTFLVIMRSSVPHCWRNQIEFSNITHEKKRLHIPSHRRWRRRSNIETPRKMRKIKISFVKHTAQQRYLQSSREIDAQWMEKKIKLSFQN